MWEKAKSFMSNPIETFRGVREEKLGSALKYALTWLAFCGLLYGIVMSLMWSVMAELYKNIPVLGSQLSQATRYGYLIVPVMLIEMMVGGVVGLIVAGAWVHIWVYACGGRKGYANTVKALAYGGTPGYLLGWIPFVGIIAGIWSVVLEILGLRELHQISTGKAVAAWLIAIFIPIVIVAVVALYYLTYL